jgi:hypothetical protein
MFLSYSECDRLVPSPSDEYLSKTNLGYHGQDFAEIGIHNSRTIFQPLQVTASVVIVLPVQWGGDIVLIRLLLVVFDHTDALQKLRKCI